MTAAVKSLPIPAKPLPQFELGSNVLAECLVRIADALEVLETFAEDDEARQEALRILKGGKQ